MIYVGADTYVLQDHWAKGIIEDLKRWRAGGKSDHGPYKMLMKVDISTDGEFQYLGKVRFKRNIIREISDRPYPENVFVLTEYAPHLRDLLSVRLSGINADGFIAGEENSIRSGTGLQIGSQIKPSLDLPSYSVIPVRFVNLEKRARATALRQSGLPEYLFGTFEAK